MANTRHTYHLHSKEVEEIIRNNGLPSGYLSMIFMLPSRLKKKKKTHN